MLLEKLNNYKIILGSASTRRRQLLEEMGINFSTKITLEQEDFPKNLKGKEIAEFLARKKSNFILKDLAGNYLLITADTIVIQNDKILDKPKDKEDAVKILQNLSGSKHKVISGVCIKSQSKEVTFSSVSEVSFNDLSEKEIIYYIDNFKPFDKAGSYGIQEWIGYIGIKKVNGSYNNVVGLPTAELYQKLKLFI
jgi:septum formation protein